MPEMERHETSSIRVVVEVEGNTIRIEAEIKDNEVFPQIEWTNKKIRARLTDQAADQIKALLSQRFPTQGDRKGRMIPVLCKGCGKPFEVEIPCCGKKMEVIKCPHCGKEQTLKAKGAA
ncbi:MAG: hypothetical protein JXA50_01840 [Deltaproteobacteria bacterium]|nr:hypothetical protein [Deltaproteobacteria bacterium]